MRKIAVALSKGGVGKTTTAVNLAAGLARMGHKVLLVDVDTQGQVSRALGVQTNHSLADLADGKMTPSDAAAPARDNLWILPGGRALAALKQLISRKEFGGEMTLSETLEPFEGAYDYVIMDTSPGWDPLAVNTFFYVQEVLAPVSLEVMTLQSLMEFSRSLQAIQKYRKDLKLNYIVPTFYDRRVRKSEEILEQLAAHFGEQMCLPVRYNVRLSEAPGYGQSIFEYAPHSAGAEDYQKLVERVASAA